MSSLPFLTGGDISLFSSIGALSRQFEASPAGQRCYLEKVIEIMRGLPDGLGRGVIWWAPEWIEIEGHASSWDGRALFDRDGRALPALDAFVPI